MKLKALLLGSAAAMIAVSGARAADAVIAEPEPVEYVKVCDLYGSGFFYIPGTETCLAISGEVRVQYNYNSIEVGNNDLIDEANPVALFAANADVTNGTGTWYGRVNFDARNETDYGTLRSYIRLGQENGTNASEAGVTVKDAYIELGGLSTGYRTHRAELTGLPGQMFDGSYHGGGRVMYMDYTYAANGLAIIGGVSLDNAIAGNGNSGNANAGNAESVDAYIRADYTGSIFTIGGVYAYDTSSEEAAYGIYANVRPLDGLTIQGYYNDQTGATQFGSINSDDDQAWGIGAQYAILDNLSVVAGYYEREKDGTSFATANIDSGYSVGLNWAPVSGLAVRVAYNHEDKGYNFGNVSRDWEEDNFRIRIQRNF